MKRLLKPILFALALLSPSWAFCFPPALDRAFVGLSNYKKIADGVYADPHLSAVELQRALSGLRAARSRIAELYGEPVAKPVTIIAGSAKEAARFGVTDVPGTAFVSLGATHVVLNMEEFSLDVTAHELVHAELAERLGYWARARRLPTWLDEGLALQVDLRPQYLGDCAAVGRDEMRRARSLDSPRNFWSTDKAQNIRNYQTAKCAVAELLEKHPPKSLYAALSRLRQGDSYGDVFGVD